MLLVLLQLCNLYSGTFIPVMYIQRGGTRGAAKFVTDVLTRFQHLLWSITVQTQSATWFLFVLNDKNAVFGIYHHTSFLHFIRSWIIHTFWLVLTNDRFVQMMWFIDLLKNWSKFYYKFIFPESQRGLEIAFKMLDKDGNGRLCKEEYFVVG